MAEQNEQPGFAGSGAIDSNQVPAPAGGQVYQPSPQQPAPPPQTENRPQTSDSFVAGQEAIERSRPVSDDGITWTASEYIAHEKAAGWYAHLIFWAIILALLLFLITRDLVSVFVVAVGALFFGVYGARKPRQLPYRLNDQGVQIGEKWLGFGEFRSFSVIPEGAFSSIVFMPLKRFAAPTTIYYSPQDEDQILGILSATLPYEARQMDSVERLMRHLRF